VLAQLGAAVTDSRKTRGDASAGLSSAFSRIPESSRSST